MKFIHAGDCHFGNVLTGISQRVPEHYQQVIRSATQRAFAALVALACREQVDFVLFPGDFLQNERLSAATHAQLQGAFERLQQAKIPVYVSFGNHDFAAAEDLAAQALWPANVVCLPRRVTTTTLTTSAGERVAITGFSYQTARQNAAVMADFPLRMHGVDYHIGAYHGMSGRDGDPYAPFQLSDLLAKDYDYWALGHIHQRQTLYERPLVSYSGALQGLNPKETGAKGCYLVTVANGQWSQDFIDIAPVRWETCTVTGERTAADVADHIVAAVAVTADLVLVHVTITAPSATLQAAAQLATLQDAIQEQLPAGYWVHAVVLADDAVAQPQAALDAHYWEQALTMVLSDDVLRDVLPTKIPAAIRRQLLAPEYRAQLRADLQARLLER